MAPLACASQDGIIDADAFDRHFDKIRYLGWCFISLSTLGLFVVLGHCTVLYLVYLVMYLSFCMGILSMIITHIFNRDKFSHDVHKELRQLWLTAANSNVAYVKSYLMAFESEYNCCGFYNVLDY